jgi:hypothetical protein
LERTRRDDKGGWTRRHKDGHLVFTKDVEFTSPSQAAAIVHGVTKKLGTIRREIEEALAPTGGDRIQRLERQIASAKRKGDRTEVLEGLKRFLQLARKEKRPKNRPGTRKGRKQAG